MQFSRSQRRWSTVIAVLIIGGFFLIRHLTAPAPVQYQTVKVANRDLQQNVLATGKLDAVRKVDVGAQVSGQLEKLYVEIGDQVKQGQLLAMIDPQQAQNQIKEVEATLQDLNVLSWHRQRLKCNWPRSHCAVNRIWQNYRWYHVKTLIRPVPVWQ